MLSEAPSSASRYARWVLVGVLVPVFFAWLDDRLLRGWLMSSEAEMGAGHLALFVLQVGTFSVLCGRLIEVPFLRWAIFVWCWLLIDMQLLIAHWLVPRYYQGSLLVAAMFATQVGLVTIWGVLGTTKWAVRIPLSVVLAAVLAVPLARDPEPLFAMQTVSLLALCGMLRWKRFRLARPTDSATAELLANDHQDSAVAPRSDLRSAQFGIRHVLIWTTSLAIVLGIARGFDMLSYGTVRIVLGLMWLPLLTTALLAAVVLVVAMWAALGEGPAWQRWPLLAVFATSAGMTAALIERMSDTSLRSTLRERPWRLDFWVNRPQWEVVMSYLLASSLLFATLLIFRTLSYRLERRAQH